MLPYFKVNLKKKVMILQIYCSNVSKEITGAEDPLTKRIVYCDPEIQ
jgi:hypothetical protein